MRDDGLGGHVAGQALLEPDGAAADPWSLSCLRAALAAVPGPCDVVIRRPAHRLSLRDLREPMSLAELDQAHLEVHGADRAACPRCWASAHLSLFGGRT